MPWADDGNAGARRARRRRRFVALWLGLFVFGWIAFGGADGVRAEPTVDEIAAHVRAATGAGPERMRFRQDVELQLFLFRWSFYSDVVRDEDGIDVQVHGAPSFLSPDVSASLLEVSEGLDGFELRLVDVLGEGDGTYYVVQGEAKTKGGGGASSGTIWVNGRTWLVEKATLQYPWGAMTVEQTFQTVNGYTLLKEQIATVDRLGAKLRVQYGGYSID